MRSLFFVFCKIKALRLGLSSSPCRFAFTSLLALQLGSLSVSLSASQTSVNEALLEAESASNTVPKQQSTAATQEPIARVATAKPAIPAQPSSGHDERLQILNSERETILKKIASADPDQRERLNSDLAAINREIDIASKSKPLAANTSNKQVSSQKKSGNSDNQPPRLYESWDIFRNFGQKED